MDVLFTILFTMSGVILFSLFDYFGFNISLKKGWAEFNNDRGYRVVQGILQAVLTAVLIYFSGWRAAIGFNIIWWTWGCDFLFYLYCEIFNFGNDRGNFRKEVLSGSVQWAWWTPYGLMFTKKGDVIKHKILVIQGVTGAVAAGAVIMI